MATPTPQRIVVKETTYFQARGSPAMSVMASFVRPVASEEVPYQRPKVKVTEAWQPVDVGWLKKASMVILENPLEKRNTIPTAEETRAAGAKVLVIGVDYGEGPPLAAQHCPPGESVRVNPPFGSVSALRMRCLSGECLVTLTAFPAPE